MQNTRQVVLPATKLQLSCLGEGGKRDHWYWVSRVPDQTPEEETAGVGPLILSRTVLLHIELGHAQARGGDWVTHLLPVSWTGKSRRCSIRRLTSGHQRVSHMRLGTRSPDSQSTVHGD